MALQQNRWFKENLEYERPSKVCVQTPCYSPKFQCWNLKKVSTSCDNSWRPIFYEMASEYVRNSMELSDYKIHVVWWHTMWKIWSEEIWMLLEICWILFATWKSV